MTKANDIERVVHALKTVPEKTLGVLGATKLGANAIVGFRTEREQHKRSITYYVYGTAVIVEDEQ